MGAKFGDAKNPLLVSVRSGARASMPGMMDTILNLGLNDKTAAGLAAKSGNERFAYDSYRRFVAMYGDVVLGLKPENKEDHDPFDVILAAKKKARGVKLDSELPADALKELVAEFKAEIKNRVGVDFPDDPYVQLEGAIKAVFQSWQNDRANLYRRLNNIPAEWGTAVNVQAMVFGNKGADSATGVCFTRDPASGENVFYGEFLVNAQGEDVVAGIRTPEKIEALGNVLPKAYKQLLDIRKKLEKHYKDMQDIEFTIENGTLYMLQCRNGKRTGFAGVRIAVEMVDEKLISKEEALRRVEPEALNQLLRPVFLPAGQEGGDRGGAPARQGAARRSGRGDRQGRVLRRRGGGAGGQGRDQPDPVPPRDQPGGHPRHERVARLHDRVRRHDQPRGAGRAADGQGLHRRLRRAVVRLPRAPDEGGDREGDGHRQGRRLDLDRRLRGRGDQRPRRHDAVGGHPRAHREEPRRQGGADLPDLRQADELGGRRAPAARARQRRPARSGGGGGGVRRRGHRPLPHRAHVLRRGQDRPDARDDRRRDRGRPAQGAGQAAAAAARGLRRDLPGDEGAAGHDPDAGSPAARVPAPRRGRRAPSWRATRARPSRQVKARIEDLKESNPMLGHRGCRLGITYPEITEMQARAVFEAAVDVAAEGIAGVPGDHDPARRDEEGARPAGGGRPQGGRRSFCGSGARRSAISSAR